MSELNIEQVKKSIELLKPNDELYEIRIMQGSGKRKTIISGYFKGTKNLEKAFSTIDLRRANVFYTLNKINDGCYSREQHEKFLQIDDTTSDSDIVSYEWFLVDVDPKRNSGISSTDEELKAAQQTAEKIRNFLCTTKEFKDPIVALSGNGCHLLFKIDEPKSNEDLIKRCLQALSYLFSDDKVDIDTSVFNPSRVSKLYGSMARKGANTEERPHRLSKIVKVPKQIKVTDTKHLEWLASELPEPEKPARIQKSRPKEFDIEQWLSDHSVGVYKTTHTTDGATKYILEQCPFDGSHRAPDSMVIVQQTGQIGFRCLHNSCSGKTWQDMRLLYEPDAYDDKRAADDERIEEGWKKHKQYLITKVSDDVEEIKKALPQVAVISAKDLQEKEFAATYYAVEGMIPEGETVIAAPPKTGKSWLMLDMCLRVARGEPFLGFETRKSDTLYLALEDGDKFEQERLNIVCPEEAPDNFHFVFDNILHMNEGFTMQLDGLLEKLPNIKLVVIDTLNFVQYHPGKGESAYNCDYRTGRDLKSYAESHGIAIVVVTHTTKMIHAEDEMMNVSGTNGVTGAADAVVVLSKEKRTDLDAKMFITGRKVRQTMHEIRFDDNSCRWIYKGEADLSDKEQVDRAKKESEYMNSQIRTAVINVASELSDGDSWRGRSSELIEKALDYNIGLVESPKEIGGFMCRMLGLFMKIDGVKVERIKNGTGPYFYRIYPQIEQEEINDGWINFE